MESSIFVSAPIKGVFQHLKVKRRGSVASTVDNKIYMDEVSKFKILDLQTRIRNNEPPVLFTVCKKFLNYLLFSQKNLLYVYRYL